MSGFLLDTNVISEFNRRGEPTGRFAHERLAQQVHAALIAVRHRYLFQGCY